MTINVNCPPRGLFIGRETENVARTLAVDFSAWAAEHGPGTLQILFQRPGTESPYAVVLTRDGTTATWKPSETDLAEAGTGAVQIIYTVGDVRVKTSIIPVMVEPSLGVETDPPEGWTSWIDQLTDLAAVTEQHAASAAESAENAGDSATDAQRYATDAADAKNAAVAAAEAAAASASHYPQIVGGVWYVWSPTAGEYISTGIDAQGEDGVSPTVEITAIQGGHRVVITDAEGPHTFDVMDGVTPDLSAYRTAADQDVIDDAQDEELDHLKSALDTKAGILRDTASGSVASFVPDATIDNLLGLSVAVEPIQDLHGYDSPWPAGGGKNLFDPAIFEENDGVLQTDGSYYFASINQLLNKIAWDSGGYEGQIAITFVRKCEVNKQSLRLYINYTDGTNTRVGLAFATGGVDTYTAVSDASKIVSTVTFDYGSNLPTYAKLQVEKGSTATAWTPYSNICPISGRESVEVEATGINIWDEEWEEGYYGSTGKPSGGSGYIRSKNYISVKPNESYYCKTGTASNFCLQFYGADKTFLSQNFTWRDSVVTIPSDCYYLRFWRNETTYGNDISINHPSTAHDYHPYAGNRYTIQLGQTVYGGDIGVVSGEGESKMGMVDMGALDWRRYNFSGVFCFYVQLPNMKAEYPYGLCESYEVVTARSPTRLENGEMVLDNGGHSRYVYLRNDAFSDVAEFKAAMSGVQLVYELDTPTPISTTPTEINTVEGQNNVFSPDGDVTVEYAADLKTYIDNKIAAAVAALS